MAMRLGRVVEQQFGDTFVATVGDGATRSLPGEQTFLNLDALCLGLVFGQTDPGHFGVAAGHAGVVAGIEASI